MELVGASRDSLRLGELGANATLHIDHRGWTKVRESLSLAATRARPDRVYLRLENVRGTKDASILSVYINIPDFDTPGEHPELCVGSFSLFGLHGASNPNREHGGNGLNFTIDISDFVDKLHLSDSLNMDLVKVRLVPDRPIPENANITVGRIGIYREGR